MEKHFHIIGSGAAGLAAAVYAIRDAKVPGANIHIYEEGRAEDVAKGCNCIGGALDASGDRKSGFVMRGGRMFEQRYVCTYDVLSSIPVKIPKDASAPGAPVEFEEVSAAQDIENFTRKYSWKSTARLVDGAGRIVNVMTMGFNTRDRIDLARLAFFSSERSLADKTIEDVMNPHFFQTNFWLMWCSMFSFQPWHSAIEMKRYLRRFFHLFSTIGDLSCVWHTRYNQYDSMVKPMQDWLVARGVQFEKGASVYDMDIDGDAENYRVTKLKVRDASTGQDRDVDTANDFVFVTNGSMTDAADVQMSQAKAVLKADAQQQGGAWKLWRALAAKQPFGQRFGAPDKFTRSVEQSKWPSFTVTTESPLFAKKLREMTGREYGREGLITFTDSPWLLTVHPHFHPVYDAQDDGRRGEKNGDAGPFIWWGYGLNLDRKGACVDQRIEDCDGRQFLEEALHHFRIEGADRDEILARSIAIPCMMPYITSQFMPRRAGDRPDVVPQGSANLAFIGQFAEAPEDCVFTVEYSVRTAKMAVKQLLEANGAQTGMSIAPIYRGWRDPKVALRSTWISLRPGWWPA